MIRAWSFQLLKSKKRVFLSLISLFLTAGIVLADGNTFTISGRVQTEDGQRPPNGTTVRLSTPRGGLVAQRPVDTGGGFVFDALPKGTYELTASAKGFESATKEIDQRFWITDVFVRLTLTENRIRKSKPGGILQANNVIPESARKEYKKGKKAYKSGDLPRAEKYFEKAVKEHACYPEAQVDLSIVAGLRHENAKAESALQKVVDCDPGFLPAYFRLGFLLNAEKRFDESAKVLRRGLSYSQEVGELHHQLAVALAGLGKYADAEQEYLRVLSLDKRPSPRVHAELANVYLRQDKYADAYKQMKAYIKAAPKGPLAPAVRKSMREMEKSGVLGSASR
ncbi:MAG: carboxypeptidase regulatory-like domain-containing protein [Acidobacteriota bacterium]